MILFSVATKQHRLACRFETMSAAYNFLTSNRTTKLYLRIHDNDVLLREVVSYDAFKYYMKKQMPLYFQCRMFDQQAYGEFIEVNSKKLEECHEQLH